MGNLIGQEVWMLTASEPDMKDLEGVYASRDKAEKEVLKTYEILKNQPWEWQDFSEIDRTEDYTIYEGKWLADTKEEIIFGIYVEKVSIQ